MSFMQHALHKLLTAPFKLNASHIQQYCAVNKKLQSNLPFTEVIFKNEKSRGASDFVFALTGRTVCAFFCEEAGAAVVAINRN